MLLFTLAISLVAGLLFGAIPILKYARPHLATALKDSSRGSSEGRERHRARNTLVVAQVALAAVLLVASGLMVRTFIAMRDVPPGFQQSGRGAHAAHHDSHRRVIDDPAQVGAHCTSRSRTSIEAIGGVESVGVSSSITMDGNSSNDPICVEDFPEADGKFRRCAASSTSAPATSRRWATR